MIKVFDIPIYAMTEEEFRKRRAQMDSNLYARFQGDTLETDRMERIIFIETYPARCWDYNHIVGYIKIQMQATDAWFSVYLPYDKKKYFWNSKKKIHLHDIQANGIHFRIEKNYSNEEIQLEMAEMLDFVIKEHVPLKYFVDDEAFRIMNSSVDYKKLLSHL